LTFRAIAWRLRTKGARRILIADAAYVTALPGVLLACGGPGVTKTAVFADIYTYMADVSDASRAQSVRHKVIARFVRLLYSRLDGFILLTEHMNAVVNHRGKPHLVMEGMADARAGSAAASPATTPEHPTVLYAGALRKVYGLDALLAGFAAWRNDDARLVIYGAGDYGEEIRAAAAEDHRVDFRGSASISDVFAAEKRATLLVNPRPIDQEFTKYSFPSKTMEYMSSGTPVLTTALPGMPPEYYPHVLLIKEPGAAGVTEALKRVFSEPAGVLAERGRRAQAFVLTEKSNEAQAKRILEFAEGL
jgi:glycosyltransferase involved in cell wall biosynthesis